MKTKFVQMGLAIGVGTLLVVLTPLAWSATPGTANAPKATQPAPAEHPRMDGATIAVDAILDVPR